MYINSSYILLKIYFRPSVLRLEANAGYLVVCITNRTINSDRVRARKAKLIVLAKKILHIRHVIACITDLKAKFLSKNKPSKQPVQKQRPKCHKNSGKKISTQNTNCTFTLGKSSVHFIHLLVKNSTYPLFL